jgi:Cu+-exporting ATPase
MAGRTHHHHHPGHAAQAVRDPVCGMDVDPTRTAFTSEYEGQAFFFCSAHCKATFDANPADFGGAHAGH